MERVSTRQKRAGLLALLLVVALVAIIVVDRRIIGSLRAELGSARGDVDALREDLDAARAEATDSEAHVQRLEAAVEEVRRQLADAEQSLAQQQVAATPRTPAIGGGCADGSYSIGYQGPPTGDYAGLGDNMISGVRLAVAQAHRGKLALPSGEELPPGLRLAVRAIDTQGDPSNAPAAAYEAIGEDTLLALVGPSFSGEAQASAPLYEDAGIPFVTPSATSPNLKRQGWKNFFRIVGDDEAQAAATAQFIARNLGARRVAIMSESHEYGASLADGVAKSLETKYGVEIVARQQVKAGDQDYRAAVRPIAKSGAEAIYYGGYYQEAGLIKNHLAQAGARFIPFVSDDGAFDEGYFATAQQASANTYVAYPGTEVQDVPAAFGTAYNDKFGTGPGAFSVEAYMATTLIIDAIAAAGCNRGAIRKHLASFDAKVLGRPIDFASNGQITDPRFTFYTVRNSWWVPKTTIGG